MRVYHNSLQANRCHLPNLAILARSQVQLTRVDRGNPDPELLRAVDRGVMEM